MLRGSELKGPTRPSAQQMKVLEAFAMRPGTKLVAIAEVQGVTLDFVEQTIDEWGGDEAGVKQAVEWYKTHPVEQPKETQQEEKPVPTATVDKTAAAAESVFPLPDTVEPPLYPELDELTGPEILALIREGDHSTVVATRHVAEKAKAALAKLVTTVKTERAQARERHERGQIAAATKLRLDRLARETQALAAGEVTGLAREWLTRTTGKPAPAEVTFEQVMEYLHSQ